MTPIIREGASAEAKAAAVGSSSSDADDSLTAEEEEEAIGKGIGPKYETAAAALQELIGRAIGQVEGLARGEEGREEGGALANEQVLGLPWLARLNGTYIGQK